MQKNFLGMKSHPTDMYLHYKDTEKTANIYRNAYDEIISNHPELDGSLNILLNMAVFYGQYLEQEMS